MSTAVSDDKKAPEGYHLVWSDEFDSDTLDEADWNYEEHEPGWVKVFCPRSG